MADIINFNGNEQTEPKTSEPAKSVVLLALDVHAIWGIVANSVEHDKPKSAALIKEMERQIANMARVINLDIKTVALYYPPPGGVYGGVGRRK